MLKFLKREPKESGPLPIAADIQEQRLAKARRTFNSGRILIYVGSATVVVGVLCFPFEPISGSLTLLKVLKGILAYNKIVASGNIVNGVGTAAVLIGWRNREKAKKTLGMK